MLQGNSKSILILICLFLTAYQVASSPTSPVMVQPSLQAESTQTPLHPVQPSSEMTQIPNGVPLTALDTFGTLPDGSQSLLKFVTGVPGNHQIQIPLQGSFELKIKAGANILILDNDARDGEASIQLPSQNIDFYLKPGLQGSAKSMLVNNASLELKDELYANTATLNGASGWTHLPKRPIPVPAAWQQGEAYTLHFRNAGVPYLSLRSKSSNSREFPPGVAEIGLVGGRVELPRIASLYIPPLAVLIPTTIVLKQERQVPDIIDILPDGSHQRASFLASPVVTLYPKDLHLLRPGQLRLNHYATMLKRICYSELEWFMTKDPHFEEWEYAQKDIVWRVEQFPYEVEDEIPCKSFGKAYLRVHDFQTFTIYIEYFFGPKNRKQYFDLKPEFQIQQDSALENKI